MDVINDHLNDLKTTTDQRYYNQKKRSYSAKSYVNIYLKQSYKEIIDSLEKDIRSSNNDIINKANFCIEKLRLITALNK